MKLELENKNPSIQIQQGLNMNFNPQFKRPPLQILWSEIKDQQDSVQPPLYIEDEPEEMLEEALKFQENQYSTLSKEEVEPLEEGLDMDTPLDEEEIDAYYKKFADMMQVELHKIYYLRSRKRSRNQDPNDDQVLQNTQRSNDKGKESIKTILVTRGKSSQSQQAKPNQTSKARHPMKSKQETRENTKIDEQIKVEKGTRTFNIEKELKK